MEITVNLDEIFTDEEVGSGETTQSLIRRMVVADLASGYRQGLKEQVKEEVLNIVRAEIQQIVQEKGASIVEDLMNAEFTPVDRYGKSASPTTFKSELTNAIVSECTFKPRTSSSYGDENAFTKAIKSLIKEQLDAFKSEFSATVDTSFRRDAMAFAVEKLRERLGLPK
jgi:hypothetical protein